MIPTLSITEQGSGLAIFTKLDSLSDDLLFEILVRLQAEDVLEKAIFMCRRWNRLINGSSFIDAHLRHASYGLLLCRNGREQFFVSAAQDRIEISQLNCVIRYPNPISCNGLMLDVGVVSDSDTYSFILNPTTRCTLKLPSLFGHPADSIYFGMAYVASSMEYKVVGIYIPDSNSKFVACGILTVGVDKSWRHVSVDKFSFQVNQLLLADPLHTEGFLHWAPREGEGTIVTLNVETEVMTETPLHLPFPLVNPRDYGFLGYEYDYLTTGRRLSACVFRKDYLWEVWEMKPENGEWRKLVLEINLGALKCRIQQQMFGVKKFYWVKYPEVLAVFPYNNRDRSFIIYNLCTNEIDSMKLPFRGTGYRVAVHRKSLVCLR